MRNLDNFYCKAINKITNDIIKDGLKPVVLSWDGVNYFITTDRVVFYILPGRIIQMFNSEFIKDVSEIYPGHEMLTSVYGNEFKELLNTGNIKWEFMGNEDRLILELKGDHPVYIREDLIKVFPKQRVYCESKDVSGPVFILSNLKVLLGGIWPVKR